MTTQIKQIKQTTQASAKQLSIKQVSHSVAGDDPAGLGLALAVARELHAPVNRAPEVSTAAAPRSRRTPAHRRTVLRG
ncbi:hypothetical protein ACIPC1_36225 [Streptomyces sp. NPDC087263]|uniref:hypothetical protein n=1 Tax=Streptomyces sp. NPDC087263 TaxID=3365773 RepID=UPI003824AFF0